MLFETKPCRNWALREIDAAAPITTCSHCGEKRRSSCGFGCVLPVAPSVNYDMRPWEKGTIAASLAFVLVSFTVYLVAYGF